MSDPRHTATRLAEAHLDTDAPLDWFEALYADSGEDPEQIPWADQAPNPALVSWLTAGSPPAGRALVVGCGLGDDAEALARAGFDTTAFDLSKSAITWAQRRFPNSPVDYHAANLLQLPEEWFGAFDLVFEAYTLQAIPLAIRQQATPVLAQLLRPGGQLLIIARGRGEEPASQSPPWPLARHEIEVLEAECGLEAVAWDDFIDSEDPPIRRFRATYRRPA